MAPSGQVVEKRKPEDPALDPVPDPAPGRELQSWQCLVSYLCFYGFMAQMRPGESFITPCLLGPSKNFSQFQVSLPWR